MELYQLFHCSKFFLVPMAPKIVKEEGPAPPPPAFRCVPDLPPQSSPEFHRGRVYLRKLELHFFVRHPGALRYFFG